MRRRKRKADGRSISPIFLVSGGTGTSGRQLVNTILAQFPGAEVPVVTVAHVHNADQLNETVKQACESHGIIVQTLVDTCLRDTLNTLGGSQGIPVIDLMGELMRRLEEMIGTKPVCSPGLYRRLNKRYFDRVEAIEFSITHDDGQSPQDISQAEIVLVGASRVGKTPLSMYLAMQGFRTANVPYIPGQSLMPELVQVESGRIIGLMIDAQRLVSHRMARKEKLMLKGYKGYSDLAAIFNELEQARALFREKGYSIIDVTDKPLETSAEEIVKIITRRFGEKLYEPDACINDNGRV
ncbi:MAG TPA: pyruvate, water dikinase regulatory protein [Desulfomonilia bacterium]|nr:pyruvate, water dikinase regulatory protein [Desulfomonilia bacterium]